MSDPALSRAEWIVLALIVERPSHGFAIAALTRADGPIGQVWEVPRPIVYRAIRRLADQGLIVATVVEEGERGPDRTIFAAAPGSDELVRAWLDEPARHIRDVRSDTLVKLALLMRRGLDVMPLLIEQRDTLSGIRRGLRERAATDDGFERVLAMWRVESAEATLRFLTRVIEEHGRAVAEHTRT